jgi:hypothetical protein
MRVIPAALSVSGAVLSIWAAIVLIGWWQLPDWHATREPIISSFFLIVAGAPFSLVAAGLAAANIRTWSGAALYAGMASGVLWACAALLWWYTDGAPS